MNSLGSLIIRILSGERLRRARPEERRSVAATFFVIGVWFEVFFLAQKYWPTMFERIMGGNAFELWIAFSLAIAIAAFSGFLLWKYLSTKVLVIMAILAWVVLLGTLFRFGVFAGELP